MKKFVLLLFSLILAVSFVFPAFAADPVPVSSITLDQEEAVVAVGKAVALKATLDPKNATDKKLEWSSSDDSIATVKNGKVSGVSVGTAVITATAADGSGASASATVTVIKPVKKIKVVDSKLTLAPGVKWKQSLIFDPTDATNQDVIWTSSNEAVATVNDKGVITAVSEGKCNIVGVAADGYKAKVSVAVVVKEHDVVITEPGIVNAGFVTTDYETAAGMQVGNLFWGIVWKTTVEYKNGFVAPGGGDSRNTLRPVKPGSDIITVIEKENGRTTSKKQYTAFVSQEVFPTETDQDIGRLAAESFEKHTYQAFYSARSWDEANEFCKRHGGHLVTITSMAEQEFLVSYLAKAEKKESYWIGLDSGNKTDFSAWITKEKLSFMNWMDNNPDRELVNSCARMAATEYTDETGWLMQAGTWDDADKNYAQIVGFVCEWDKGNSPNAMPEKEIPGEEPEESEAAAIPLTEEEILGKYSELFTFVTPRITDDNKIKMLIGNKSTEETVSRICIKVECFDTEGNPMVCNKDGKSTFFTGIYETELLPEEWTELSRFTVNDSKFTDPLGKVIVTVTGFELGEGQKYEIPEDKQQGISS